MKTPLLALALLAAVGFAAPASAFTPGPPFTLTGPFVIASPSITCTAKLTVAGGPGGSTLVTAASFSGGTAVCASLRAIRLPWTLTSLSLTAVQIAPVVIQTPGFTCNATSIIGAWSNTPPGVATFTSVSVPPCIVSTTLSASPPQTLP